MRFCQPHWDALRAAIETRGLSALVPDSGEQAMSNIARELGSGEQTLDTFDPLMNAHWAIVDRLGVIFGALNVIMQDGCPICAGNAAHDAACDQPETCRPNYYDAWIDRAADEQVKVWQFLGGRT